MFKAKTLPQPDLRSMGDVRMDFASKVTMFVLSSMFLVNHGKIMLVFMTNMSHKNGRIIPGDPATTETCCV
jgi:hypothetical protein